MKLELTVKEVKHIGGDRAIAILDKKVTPWAWLGLILAIIGLATAIFSTTSFGPDIYTTSDGQVIETHTSSDYILIDNFRVEATQAKEHNIPLTVVGVLSLASGIILVFGLFIWELYKGHEEGYKFLDSVIKGDTDKEQ